MKGSTSTDNLLRPHRFAILLLLVSFGSLSAVLLTPALPEFSREFGISESKAQLTMSLYLLGYALGQLPYGPIANRFGRKKAIYIGIGLMLFGSILSIASPWFWMLVLGRFIQSLGSAVGLKITFTMIGDQHSGATATRAIALLSMAFALMPGLGVTIGGYIIAFLDWRACFVFLILYAILLAMLTFFLPETKKETDRHALRFKRIAKGYADQFRSKSTVLNGLMMGCVAAMTYIFSTLAPFLGIDRIGLSPDQFGLWNLIFCAGLIIGAAIAHRLAKQERPRFSQLVGIGIIATGIGAMFLCFSFSWITAATLFLTGGLVRVGVNPVWSNASISALETSHDKSNTSAVIQFLNMGTGTVGVWLVGFISPNEIFLLPAAQTLFLLIMATLWICLRRKGK